MKRKYLQLKINQKPQKKLLLKINLKVRSLIRKQSPMKRKTKIINHRILWKLLALKIFNSRINLNMKPQASKPIRKLRSLRGKLNHLDMHFSLTLKGKLIILLLDMFPRCLVHSSQKNLRL